MTFRDLLSEKGYTVYRLSKETKLPLTTIEDIATGKKEIGDCSGKLLLGIAKRLDVTIEELLSLEKEEGVTTLPTFLKESIDDYLTAIRKRSSLVGDFGEQLKSSINVAEIEGLIPKNQADRLRNRYFR